MKRIRETDQTTNMCPTWCTALEHDLQFDRALQRIYIDHARTDSGPGDTSVSASRRDEVSSTGVVAGAVQFWMDADQMLTPFGPMTAEQAVDLAAAIVSGDPIALLSRRPRAEADTLANSLRIAVARFA